MTGFILYTGSEAARASSSDTWLPRNLTREVVYASRSAVLVSMGKSEGDVQFAEGRPGALLVMCGYVSQEPGLETGGQKQGLLQVLLGLLEKDASTEGAANLVGGFHGSFALVYVDLGRNIVFCASDRVASRPLWTRKLSWGWAISTHASALVLPDNRPSLDLGAVASTLLYRGPVEPTKSIYDGITGVPPGTVCTLNRGERVLHKWYSFRHRPDNSMSYGDWVRATAERMLAAAGRILGQPGRPMVFLSGGVDSRLAACALIAAGGSPLMVTMGDSRNYEVKTAERVAAACGAMHKVVIRDPYYYLRSLVGAAFDTGGSHIWTHAHFGQVYQDIRYIESIAYALLGDFCEALSKLICAVPAEQREIWTPDEFVRRFDGLIFAPYQTPHRDFTLSLLRPSVRADAVAQLEYDIAQRYAEVAAASDDPRIVADRFFRWHSVSSMSTFPMLLDVRGAGPDRCLMFDRDVHALLECLPSAMRDGANLGASVIYHFAHRAARVANSNTHLPIRFPTFLHVAATQIKPILGRVRRGISGDSYRTTGSWPKRGVLYRSDPIWNSALGEIITAPDSFDPQVFDVDAVARCWDSFRSGDVALARDIESLTQIAVSNWIREGDGERLQALQDAGRSPGRRQASEQ